MVLARNILNLQWVNRTGRRWRRYRWLSFGSVPPPGNESSCRDWMWDQTSTCINVQSQCTHEAANVSVSFFPVFFLSPHSGHCEFLGAERNGPTYPLNNSVVYPSIYRVPTCFNHPFGGLSDFAPIHSRDAPQTPGIRKMKAEAGRKSGGQGGNWICGQRRPLRCLIEDLFGGYRFYRNLYACLLDMFMMIIFGTIWICQCLEFMMAKNIAWRLGGFRVADAPVAIHGPGLVQTTPVLDNCWSWYIVIWYHMLPFIHYGWSLLNPCKLYGTATACHGQLMRQRRSVVRSKDMKIFGRCSWKVNSHRTRFLGSEGGEPE